MTDPGKASAVAYDVVVPTVGRPSLEALLQALAECPGPRPRAVIVVDDRRGASSPLQMGDSGILEALRVRVLRSGGRGPAAARNVGWRAAISEWVVFLDDDVVPGADWAVRLSSDLAGQPPDVGGSQGRIEVLLPPDRRPTDWERATMGLEEARWATADLAYRRHVLRRVGGFDERFRRAFREDADIAIRVTGTGFVIVQGERSVQHPVRESDTWISLRLQRGNADDVLMGALHGPAWRLRAGAEPGRNSRHLMTTLAGSLAFGSLATRRRCLAALGAAGWLCGTAELAWARIRPGPRHRREVQAMLVTSAVLPVAASAHRLRGWLELPAKLRDAARSPKPETTSSCFEPVRSPRPRAVLFDRDGTLVEDVPYNGSASMVRPLPGASTALSRLRRAGVLVGVITNQSGIGRGLFTVEDMDGVNRRMEDLLGRFDTWQACPHAPAQGCPCRKPAAGLVLRAAAALGVAPSECVVVGDTASDLVAASAAGTSGLLVPNSATLPSEVAASAAWAPDLEQPSTWSCQTGAVLAHRQAGYG